MGGSSAKGGGKMAGQRQPIELLQAKGKKHLTKAEIEARQKTEIHAANDNIKPPKWLTAKQKTKFKKIVAELLAIDLVTNLDVDALARLIISQDQYIEITQEIKKMPVLVELQMPTGKKDGFGNEIFESRTVVNSERERLMIIQDRCFKQCRQSAADFGLTVSSRCRLAVPKPPEETKENKFAKFAR